jgi:hypothetical protein
MDRRRAKVVAAVAGGLLAGAVGAVGIGTLLWNRSTARAVRRLGAGAPSWTVVPSHEGLAGLPAPVARYLEFALTPGRPLLRSARIEQAGDFRAGGFEAPWSPFTAVEHFTAHPPGFVWDASIRMAPLVTVRIRDSYIGGVGSMLGKMASLVPVVDQSGSPRLAEGALHRYLAESPWFPTALLPGRGLAWEPIDDTTARATLTDGPLSVWMDFRFGPGGEIVSASTPARLREVDGDYVPTPWTCSFRDYQKVDGLRIPMEGEVGWILPEGELSYWRGRIVNVEYVREGE